MGSLPKDPSGNYHACFRCAGKRFKRSLKTASESEAVSLLGRIEDNARLAARGKLIIPEGADVPAFLISDGQVARPLELPQTVTLAQLIERYEAALPPGSLEESTRYTIRVYGRRYVRGPANSGDLTSILGLARVLKRRCSRFGRRALEF